MRPSSTPDAVSRAMAILDAHPDVPSLPEDDATPILPIILGLLGIPYVEESDPDLHPLPCCPRR